MKISNGLDWLNPLFRLFYPIRKMNERSGNPVSAKNYLSLLVAIIGFFGLMFGFDVLGDALATVLSTLFEVMQEHLEEMYRKHFELDLYHAQMATAYTGFLLFLLAGYFVFKKTLSVYENCRVVSAKEWAQIKSAYAALSRRCQHWWNGLDGFNKFSAAVGIVLLAIPVLSLICLALGKFVAELV